MQEIFSIIKTEDGKEMFSKVEAFLDKFQQGLSGIQVNRFVLNDVEYPTPYGKFVQAKAELASRYFQLVDLYFEIEKNKLEIEVEKNMTNSNSGLKRDLHELEAKRLQFQLRGRESRVSAILKEAALFYETYQQCAAIDDLSEEDRLKLEWQNWQEKCRNMPLVFEERYGDDFMRMALGELEYNEFLDKRRRGFGILPREMAHAVRNHVAAMLAGGAAAQSPNKGENDDQDTDDRRPA